MSTTEVPTTEVEPTIRAESTTGTGTEPTHAPTHEATRHAGREATAEAVVEPTVEAGREATVEPPVRADVADVAEVTEASDVEGIAQAASEPSSSPIWVINLRTVRRFGLALAPAGLYLGVRAVAMLVLAWMAPRDGTTMTRALTSWDGQWYLGIAAGGYRDVPGGLADAFGRRTAITPYAFFPGYPELVHWVGALPGVGLIGAAFTVTLASGVAAAYALERMGRVVGGRRAVGLILVVLFAASPMAITLSMAYSEATFCALAAWALVGVIERRWLLAGLAATGAGLVRPTAVALVAVVLVAAVIAIVRRRDGWRPWVGGLLAPVGLVGYLGYVAYITGSAGGWFTLQKQGWNSTFDWGAATWRFGLEVLADGRSVLETATVGILLAAVALVVVSVWLRLPWPLLAYGTLVLVMDVGANGLMNSKARLLLPAFTLLLPPAIGLAKRRPGTVLTVLAGVVVASAWFGAYAITAWQYAI